jgi:hypothetical protein
MLLKMVMNKAAAEIATGGVPIFHPPNPEPARPAPSHGYVEGCLKARTQPGKGRVLARLGEGRV